MNRLLARLAPLGLVLLPLAVPPLAQEQPAPQQPEQPAATTPEFGGEMEAPSADSDNPATIQGTPTISLAMPADPTDVLTGLFVIRATAELCNIAIDETTVAAMSADEAKYAGQLNLSEAAAESAYEDIRSAVESQAPDCTEGSADVAAVNEVLAIYAAGPTEAAAPAAPAGGAPATEPAAAPAPAAPAPAEPAAPAQ